MIFLISLFIHFIVSGAHSFSRKILLNFTGQFTKFRGSPCQNCPNSVAYRGLLFVRKLSFILFFKKTSVFECWHGAASNMQRKLLTFFLFKSAICKLVTLCLFLIVPYAMVIISRDAVLGSLV